MGSTHELAHALRNHLSIIQSTSEALLAHAPDQETRDGLGAIIREVENMSALVRDISR